MSDIQTRTVAADFWPWSVSTVQSPHGPIAVTDTGDGPTLLLIHVGFPSLIWRDLIRELEPSFRCVTLDAPGTGLSPDMEAVEASLSTAADAIGAVIEELDLRDVILAVHDLGGPAGINAAARMPERIASIVAINTFAWRPSGALFRGMLALMSNGIARETNALTGWMPAITATRFGVAKHWKRAERSEFRTTSGKNGGRRNFHRYMADARRNDQLFEANEAALTGPLSDRPLMTAFGQYNDPLRNEPRWKALFPAAQQHRIPRGFHFPMCDAPQTLAGHIRAFHGG